MVAVLGLFDLSLPTLEVFSEMNKAYSQSVLDPKWASQIALVEKSHWGFLAKMIVNEEWSDAGVNPFGMKKPTADIVLTMPVYTAEKQKIVDELSLQRLTSMLAFY